MKSGNFFSRPTRPMFGRRVQQREEEDKARSSTTNLTNFWDWRTTGKKASSSTTTLATRPAPPAPRYGQQQQQQQQPRSLVPAANAPPSFSAASRAIIPSTIPPSSSSSASASGHEEIDDGFWRFVERAIFTRFEERGRAPLVELVEAIHHDPFLQKRYGPAHINALLAPLENSSTGTTNKPPPYVRLTHDPDLKEVEIVWVTMAEFRRQCESHAAPSSSSSSSSSLPPPRIEGRALSPKRRRANSDHQGGQALLLPPSSPSVQASVDMQKDSYLALLSTFSKEYRAQEAAAEAESAALGARAQGVLDGFGTRDDSLRAAMEEIEAQLEGRTLERKKTGAKDRRDRAAELEARMKKDMAEEVVKARLAPLPEEEQEEVRLILRNGRDADIVVNGFNVDILRQHLRTCRPGTWLNDEVINFFMQLLKERDNALVAADPTRLPCWFFNSFFISKLLHDDHEVGRWVE